MKKNSKLHKTLNPIISSTIKVVQLKSKNRLAL